GGGVVGGVRGGANRLSLGSKARFADAQVELGASRARQTVVHRAPNKLMREPVGQPAARKLLDDAAAHGLVQSREELALLETHAAEDDFELELGAGRRRELEQLRGRRRQPREPLPD